MDFAFSQRGFFFIIIIIIIILENGLHKEKLGKAPRSEEKSQCKVPQTCIFF